MRNEANGNSRTGGRALFGRKLLEQAEKQPQFVSARQGFGGGHVWHPLARKDQRVNALLAVLLDAVLVQRRPPGQTVSPGQTDVLILARDDRTAPEPLHQKFI